MATSDDSQSDPIVIDLDSERTRRSLKATRDPAGQPFFADKPIGEDPCLTTTPTYGDGATNPLKEFAAEHPVEAGLLIQCEYRCPPGNCFKRRLNIC
tara:strand:+ start:11800 stop:12090 length:291 start_codon:yes stop_codon:yes gene_type:complete